MSVRQALLALLEQGPMYGYQLRAEFERRTGSTWPLNVGQVYTTLTRLERDGLVAESGDDGEGHVVYRVTDAGREEVADLVHHAGRAHPARRATSSPSSWPSRSPSPASTWARSSSSSAPPPWPRSRTTPGSSAPAAPPTRRTPVTWPGAWSSTRWSSRPRPRSAGSTTARPGSAAPSSNGPTCPHPPPRPPLERLPSR